VRCFSPVLYAIDTVIPLISLEQRSTWYPDPHVRDGTLTLWCSTSRRSWLAAVLDLRPLLRATGAQRLTSAND